MGERWELENTTKMQMYARKFFSMYMNLKLTQKGDEARILSMTSWSPHCNPCDFCQAEAIDTNGGRPKKRKRGRPRDGDYNS